jgi:hypothetical protein
MKKQQSNLKENINKAMKTPSETNTKDKFMESPYEKNNTEQPQESKQEEKPKRNKFDKSLKIFGGVCIAIAIAAMFFSGSTTLDTSQSAVDALKNKVSTSISAGTILLSKDQNTEAKDYTITHKANAKETKIWVWDYAAEDGDYVQVLVNGAPSGEAFMIKNKPREITVPSVGAVQIKGIKDGGGGITYAVRYEINGTSYFNGTPEGQLNTYTLKLQE